MCVRVGSAVPECATVTPAAPLQRMQSGVIGPIGDVLDEERESSAHGNVCEDEPVRRDEDADGNISSESDKEEPEEEDYAPDFCQWNGCGSEIAQQCEHCYLKLCDSHAYSDMIGHECSGSPTASKEYTGVSPTIPPSTVEVTIDPVTNGTLNCVPLQVPKKAPSSRSIKKTLGEKTSSSSSRRNSTARKVVKAAKAPTVVITSKKRKADSVVEPEKNCRTKRPPCPSKRLLE